MPRAHPAARRARAARVHPRNQEFRSLAFEVNRDVFVPRPETETLVEAALAFLGESQRNAPAFADIGTGSGCLAVSLAHTIPTMSVVATDRSEGALAVARRNAARHGVEPRVRFVRCNQLDALAADAPLDGVVCNPPYVLPSEERSLPRARLRAARGALRAARRRGSGLRVDRRRREATFARRGALFVEIGEGQGISPRPPSESWDWARLRGAATSPGPTASCPRGAARRRARLGCAALLGAAPDLAVRRC